MSACHAPPPFAADGALRTFVDIAKAKHAIDLDPSGSAVVKSKIELQTFARGTPILDVHLPGGDASARVWIDGQETAFVEVGAPGAVTKYRTLDTVVDPGRYDVDIEIQHPPRALAPPGAGPEVIAFLAMRDTRVADDAWDGRLFLERYLPSNLEFDQHPTRIDLNATWMKEPFLATNGCVRERSRGSWKIQFPSTFTASCAFLYLGDRNQLRIEGFAFPRASGGALETVLFASATDAARIATFEDDVGSAWQALAELQQLYGPFPHPSLHIHLGHSGMEYAGAAEVSGDNMLHELAHSYFGRSVLPADGNAGWIDEGIACWTANRALVRQFPRLPDEYESPSDPDPIGAHSAYLRTTSAKAHSVGFEVIRFLDTRLRRSGGILPALVQLHAEFAGQVITTADFQRVLERHAGRSLAPEFDTFVYGRMSLEDYRRYLDD